MKDIFQLVVGIPGNERIIFTRRDENRLLDYAKIYKDRLALDLLAYCLKPSCAQFLLYDGTGKKDIFAHKLTEAYGYYLQLICGHEVRLTCKFYPMDTMDKYMNMMKLFHREGRNSLFHYQTYSRYVKDEFLNVALVLNTFHESHGGNRDHFIEELVSEPAAVYVTAYRKAQIFKLDKLAKRRERARAFMNAFIEEQGLTEGELLTDKDLHMKKLLIKKFREETDLSFRDIGHVLGISHTTVIRIYRELE